MIRRFFFLALLSIVPMAYVSAQPVQAVQVIDNSLCSGKAGNSPACKDKGGGGGNPITGPDGILTSIVNVVSILVGIAAVIMIVIGGFKLITSGSNPQEVTKGREAILYAIIAVVIAALAQVIVRFFINKIFP